MEIFACVDAIKVSAAMDGSTRSTFATGASMVKPSTCATLKTRDARATKARDPRSSFDAFS
jgi:hypothetical protein